jgi:hypothetical protein
MAHHLKALQKKKSNELGKLKGHGLVLSGILLIFKSLKMSNLIKLPNREQATLCYKNNCATVYGETAQIVNAIVVTAACFSAIVLIAKALK